MAMPAPSSFSLPGNFPRPDFASFPPPPEWLLAEGRRRLVAVINHVLGQEPEALRRLMRQQGQAVVLRWRSLSLALRVTPAGLWELAPADVRPHLTLELTQASILALAQQALRGEKPVVRVEGDVQLAAEVNWLVDHVRWDMEEDLSRVLGDAAAHQVAEVGRLLRKALAGFATATPFQGSSRDPA